MRDGTQRASRARRTPATQVAWRYAPRKAGGKAAGDTAGSEQREGLRSVVRESETLSSSRDAEGVSNDSELWEPSAAGPLAVFLADQLATVYK